ncbi:AAA family ATPase [Candidatus Marithrix sp. Canyon 246]|uniref:AAA family ATPase n=1 Tax=Candidatus Marithrix sp. Canyon 246 TaxID=1827136 RepID=UPI00084A1542|nr:AAA family ATPase [Candidatus Marithrix sp. Canyon 246]
MRLLRLYIHNSGVFKNTLIDFTHNGEPQNLICLAGVNGSGKTTVMELIFNLINFINPDLSLQNISFDRLRANVLTWTEFAQLDILIKDKVLSLVLGDLNNIQIHSEYIGKQGFIIENEIKTMIKDFEDNFVKIPEDYDHSQIQGLNIYQETIGLQLVKSFSERKIDYKEGKITNDIQQNIPFIYFFNSHDREIQDIHYSSIPQQKLKYEIAHRYNPNKDDLTRTLVFYDYALSKKFNELKAWINKHVLVGKTIKEIDRINFQVVIETKDGEKHGLELLSSGEESLLIIATQLYLRASQNAIFLIDEVDQSLHPEFQEQVMRLLKQLQKDTDCQIIISSHSEIIWDQFKDKGFISLTELVI